jgi:DUF3071 family protein
MRELQLVGLSADGSSLVLATETGEEFSVAADGRLRAALRGDRARLGQLEIEMDSDLRPRDIQARIRAGESPEAVAQEANAPVERILGYAGPVIAERQHIAERARRSAVRRRAGEGLGRILGDCVEERLGGRGIDPQSAEWDAWRREDGRWTVAVDYRSGERERSATFVYDAPGRYVVAENDDGRWLVGEQSTSHGPQPREPGQGRRLASVSDQLPAGPEDSTMDLSDEAAAVRATALQSAAAPDDALVPAEGRDDLAALADVISAPAAELADGELPDAEPAEGEAAGDDGGAPDAPPEPARAVVEEPRTQRRTRKDRRRASVPTWDEIMFGRGGGGGD